jgi:glycosyltransferase involved in cell wall biosynthesis
MPKVPKIHVWLPDIFQFKGGIQVYSAFLIQALEQVLPNSDRHVFLKNDAKATDNLDFNPQTKFYFCGQYKSSSLHTSVFALQVLYTALTQKPDLIICGHINFSPLVLNIFKLLKIPYWVIIHGVDAWALTDKYKIKAIKSASKIISVSQYTKNRVIQEQNMTSDLISLLPNTFDASQFTIRPKPQYLLDRYQLDADKQIILTVTRLAGSDRYKGYDQIIQALPMIRQQIPNIHYLLVGKGDDRDRIEKLIKDHHLQDCVTLTGFVPDHELNDHYNLCDVFAMPSKGEGFGIVYLEALACGKPTIGGNQDGAIDALCNGELGVLVDPDNIEQIAQAIVDTLKGRHLLPILYQPELLRETVIEIYGFDKFKERLAMILSHQFPQSI